MLLLFLPSRTLHWTIDADLPSSCAACASWLPSAACHLDLCTCIAAASQHDSSVISNRIRTTGCKHSDQSCQANECDETSLSGCAEKTRKIWWEKGLEREVEGSVTQYSHGLKLQDDHCYNYMIIGGVSCNNTATLPAARAGHGLKILRYYRIVSVIRYVTGQSDLYGIIKRGRSTILQRFQRRALA